MSRFKFILAALISVSMLSFELDKRSEKKLNKDINSLWGIETYSLDKVNTDITPQGDDIFKIINSDTLVGYVYLGQANSRSEKIDYSIIYDTKASIKKVNIINYRENYGGEVGSKRWLKQFIGKKNGEEMRFRDDISAISGATISVREMVNAINSSSILMYQNIETFQNANTTN